MGKPTKAKKAASSSRQGGQLTPAYSPQAQEMRALLRRIPDGFQATLNALAARSDQDRETVLTELVRGMGKEILPLVRAAALGTNESLALSALRVLPVFGTRAAADVLCEVYEANASQERAALCRTGALALEARGVRVAIPEALEQPEEPLQLVLRETSVSAPDGVGSRSVAARLQDAYGVWYAIFVLWNDQAGVKDGFMRPMSRHEWHERVERLAHRGDSPVACPPDYARWLVAEARKINERTGLPLEKHLEEWDRWMGAPPADYTPADPLQWVRAADPARVQEWMERSGDLFAVPDVARWFLEAADCVGWARRWNSLRTRVARDGNGKENSEELTRFLRDASRELVTRESRELYCGRLVELSRVFDFRRQDEPARQAAAAAATLADRDDHPFLLELVRRSLTATEAILARGEDPERTRYRPMRRYSS